MKLINNISEYLSGRKIYSPKAKVVCLGLLSCLLIFGFGSCTDQQQEPLPVDDTETYDISITIPKIDFGDSFSTRADDPKRDPIDQNEGRITELYVVVLKQDVDYPDQYNLYYIGDHANLLPSYQINGDYHDLTHLTLTEGQYKFYLFGNLSTYWKAGQSGSKDIEDYKKIISTEKGIRNLSLKFSDLIPSYNLPMVCMTDNVITDITNAQHPEKLKSENGEPGVLTVTKQMISDSKSPGSKKYLYFPMSILCSKVRYTVLFNNTKNEEEGYEAFSNMFPYAEDIHFTPLNDGVGTNKGTGTVLVSNIYNKTTINPLTSEVTTQTEDWIDKRSDIYQVKYPEKKPTGDNLDASKGTWAYLNIKDEDVTKSPEYLQVFDTEQANNWVPSTRRAWQGGAIYIPENTPYTQGSDSDKKLTTLTLSASGSGVKSSYEIPLEKLERGTFYDIVIKMINSDVFAVDIFVQVNPWTYQSKEAQTW